MSEQIDFAGDDAGVREVKVKGLLGKDYTLREATDAVIGQWKRALRADARLGADGKPTSLPLDAEAQLVSLTLFDEAGKAVPLAAVKGWPYRVVQKLFKAAAELNGLAPDKAEGEEKNEG